MKRSMIALILIFIVSSAYARLGETEEQFKARYGVPKAETPSPGSDKTISYTIDGVRIVGEFVNGKCLRVSYEVGWDSPSGKLQEAAVNAIFKAEGGNIWENYPGGKPNQFVRSDGLATAETGSGGMVSGLHLRSINGKN